MQSLKRYLLFLLTLGAFVPLMAQQNVGFRQTMLQSPEIHKDGKVTFRLRAPLANSVWVQGDWEAQNGGGAMKKGADGIWTFTTEQLPSDLYLYAFFVDSVRILDPVNSFSCRDVGNLFSIFLVPGGDGDAYAVQKVPHGSVQRVWYPSKQYQTYRRLTVFTPPGYELSQERYPVLYLLHGSGGDEEAWITLGRINQVLDNLIAAKKIVPLIVVMPNGNPSKQAAPGETFENQAYKPVMSHMLPNFLEGTYEKSFDEIVSFVDGRFRTKAQKAHRAIAGLSMGGFHTLYISANHPDLFDYMGLFSAATILPNIDSSKPAYANMDEKLKTQYKKGWKLHWSAMGKTDFLYESKQVFRKHMESLQIPITYVETERGHIWSNWRKYMLQFTPLLFK